MKNIEEILNGDSKNKLQELKSLEKEGVPVLKLLLDKYTELLTDLCTLLGLESGSGIEEIKKEVRKIKSPIPSCSEVNKELDKLQETLRKINSSL